MAESISFDYSNAMFMVTDDEIAAMKERVLEAKKTLVEKYDNASQKVGEYYNSAKKKAGECLDGAKGKQQDIGGEK